MVRRQKEAIDDVMNGKYTKGISPVIIPNDHIPVMPSRANSEWKTLFNILDESGDITSSWGMKRKNLGEIMNSTKKSINRPKTSECRST